MKKLYEKPELREITLWGVLGGNSPTNWCSGLAFGSHFCAAGTRKMAEDACAELLRSYPNVKYPNVKYEVVPFNPLRDPEANTKRKPSKTQAMMMYWIRRTGHYHRVGEARPGPTLGALMENGWITTRYDELGNERDIDGKTGRGNSLRLTAVGEHRLNEAIEFGLLDKEKMP